MLNAAIREAKLERTLQSRSDFHPFPSYGDRAGWAALAPEARAYYAGIGQGLLGCAWPEAPAKLYMDFVRNGNRVRYEDRHFKRRGQLYSLMICECIEGKGRFIDDIINGVWAICEETSWCLPAHNMTYPGSPKVDILPDVGADIQIVDLFAAETASLLAWVWALLGARLGEESPHIPRRIELEVERRVLGPFEASDAFGWMGFSSDAPVNNWNPWINSNILAAALILEPSPERRARLVEKVGRSTQRFLDGYAPDGGCDEGPSYFNVAGASLLDILALLGDATGGAVDLYGEPLIREMGKYIMHMHIAGPWHVNFADAGARVTPDAMLLRTGEQTGQDDLSAYARRALLEGYAEVPYLASYNTTYRRLRNLFAYDPAVFENAPKAESGEHFFPGIQVMTARQHTDRDAGLFLAAKGGHNGESHNHNDIGNYIIALDGMPVIADAGVGTYTKFTFNEARYTLWTMQSGYHNTAILNGFDQMPGTQYAARDVRYAHSGAVVTLSLDMAGAYPEAAGVDAYKRQIAFDRAEGTIRVRDEAVLRRVDAPIVLPVLSAVPAHLEDGRVRFDVGGRSLVLAYDAELFSAQTEEIVLDDARLELSWHTGRLYRTRLTRTEARMEDAFEIMYLIG